MSRPKPTVVDRTAPASPRRPVATLGEALAAPVPYAARRLERVALRATLALFGRMVEVAGVSRLDGVREPAIFVLNHGNSSEALLAPAALAWLRGGRPVRFLADWMFLELPLLGGFLRLFEPIPVYGKRARFGVREERRRAGLTMPALDRALAAIASGASLGLFPEGTRNRTAGRLLRGRSGLGELVLATAAQVVPVGIIYPSAPRLGRAPLLGRTVLSIGRPLDFASERALARALGAPARENAERRRLVRRVVDVAMAEIGRLADRRPSAPKSGPSPRAGGGGRQAHRAVTTVPAIGGRTLASP